MWAIKFPHRNLLKEISEEFVLDTPYGYDIARFMNTQFAISAVFFFSPRPMQS